MNTRGLRWTAAAALLLVPIVACNNGSSSGDNGPGAGGVSGQGGAGRGGSGGGGGAGGSGAGTGGQAGGAPGDGGPGDTGAGAPDMASRSFLNDCFAGLRALRPTSQLATKRSGNGAYEVRVALEVPPDTTGTSGTLPWRAIRLGIVTPNRTVCVKDEASLATAYKGSHHNCADTLTVSVDGLDYLLKNPDTDPMRQVTTLSITGEAAVPPVTLQTASCVAGTGNSCRSGNPC